LEVEIDVGHFSERRVVLVNNKFSYLVAEVQMEIKSLSIFVGREDTP